MIILFHPRAVKPKNRRFPLAILSIAAVVEGKEDYVIVDANLDPDPGSTMDRIVDWAQSQFEAQLEPQVEAQLEPQRQRVATEPPSPAGPTGDRAEAGTLG